MARQDSTIYNILKSMQTQTNMLGQEFNAIGRSIGDEDTGAALNLATLGLVLSLGAIAGGVGLALKNKDEQTKEFFSKALQYGGLGDPMDETGAVLPEHSLLAKMGLSKETVNRNEKKNFKTIYKSSLENLQENLRSTQDTTVQRALTSKNLWQSFTFCHQCNKNQLFFAVDGKWPPSFQINLQGVSEDEIKQLKKTLVKCGVTMEASTAQNKDGFFNIGGDYEALTKAADKLEDSGIVFNIDVGNGEFDDFKASDALRKHRDDHTLMLNVAVDDKDYKTLKGYSKNFGAKFIESETDFGAFDLGSETIESLEAKLGDGFKINDLGGGKVSIKGLASKLKGVDPEQFKNLAGFADKIKDVASGALKTTVAVYCPTGFDGLMKLMFVANSRLGGVWGDGKMAETVKQQMRRFAENLTLDPKRANLSLYYGEKSGAAKFDRTLNTLVLDEEMAQMFGVDMTGPDGRPNHAFFDAGGNCKVVNLLDRERQTEFTRRSQEELLAGLADLLKNTTPVPQGASNAFSGGALEQLGQGFGRFTEGK